MPLSLTAAPVSVVSPCLPRVIVAEDDDAFRGIISDVLRNDGYYVEEAKNGVQLLELIALAPEREAQDRIRLVVSTTTIPGNGGVGMLLGIHAKMQGIPLILISRTGDRQTQVHSPQFGEVAVIRQPFALNDLRNLVSRIVRSSEGRQACQLAV